MKDFKYVRTMYAAEAILKKNGVKFTNRIQSQQGGFLYVKETGLGTKKEKVEDVAMYFTNDAILTIY